MPSHTNHPASFPPTACPQRPSNRKYVIQLPGCPGGLVRLQDSILAAADGFGLDEVSLCEPAQPWRGGLCGGSSGWRVRRFNAAADAWLPQLACNPVPPASLPSSARPRVQYAWQCSAEHMCTCPCPTGGYPPLQAVEVFRRTVDRYGDIIDARTRLRGSDHDQDVTTAMTRNVHCSLMAQLEELSRPATVRSCVVVGV